MKTKKKLGISVLIAVFSVICIIFVTMHLMKAEDTEFDKLVDKVNRLEKCANDFKNAGNKTYMSAAELTCVYIRCDRYASGSWNFLAGSKNTAFETYVSEHDPDLKELKKINDFVLPTGETTDFVHMFAAINMAYEGCRELGSWAGDLCQLVTNIKNHTGTSDELTPVARMYLCGNSLFNLPDMYADLDANNIYDIKQKSGASFGDVMADYYNGLTHENRVKMFIDNLYQLDDFNNITLRDKVAYSFKKGSFVSSLLSSYGVYGDAYAPHRQACINAFSDYLYENYPNAVFEISNVKIKDSYYLSEESFEITYDYLPKQNIKNNKIIVTSSDGNVASCSGNIVILNNPGSVVISIEDTLGQMKQDYNISVLEDIVEDTNPDDSTTTTDVNTTASITSTEDSSIPAQESSSVSSESTLFTSIIETTNGSSTVDNSSTKEEYVKPSDSQTSKKTGLSSATISSIPIESTKKTIDTSKTEIDIKSESVSSSIESISQIIEENASVESISSSVSHLINSTLESIKNSNSSKSETLKSANKTENKNFPLIFNKIGHYYKIKNLKDYCL